MVSFFCDTPLDLWDFIYINLLVFNKVQFSIENLMLCFEGQVSFYIKFHQMTSTSAEQISKIHWLKLWTNSFIQILDGFAWWYHLKLQYLQNWETFKKVEFKQSVAPTFSYKISLIGKFWSSNAMQCWWWVLKQEQLEKSMLKLLGMERRSIVWFRNWTFQIL